MNHLWVQTLLHFNFIGTATLGLMNVNVAMKKIYEV